MESIKKRYGFKTVAYIFASRRLNIPTYSLCSYVAVSNVLRTFDELHSINDHLLKCSGI